jgi:hypothetical protein
MWRRCWGSPTCWPRVPGRRPRWRWPPTPTPMACTGCCGCWPATASSPSCREGGLPTRPPASCWPRVPGRFGPWPWQSARVPIWRWGRPGGWSRPASPPSRSCSGRSGRSSWLATRWPASASTAWRRREPRRWPRSWPGSPGVALRPWGDSRSWRADPPQRGTAGSSAALALQRSGRAGPALGGVWVVQDAGAPTGRSVGFAALASASGVIAPRQREQADAHEQL